MNIDRVVVGIDGSTGAHRALDWAMGLAARCDAEVVAVHARGLLDRYQEAAVEPPAIRIEVPPGVRLREVVRDGNPVEVLLDVASSEQADLVVVGSRGLGGYPELLLGSTSTQVAQRAAVPVVVVPEHRGG